ncbi:MAG: hypothetical protein OEW08_09325, partial [Gammaproteobacteria bacterium]|nr:hypothetical protein [Gammaproteobacteria bacterium]
RQGGSLTFVSQTWARQVEPINPLWLVQGDNNIGFAVPDGQTGNYGVKNVRIVAELDNGANFISGISAANDDPSHPVAHLLDGDTATGWRPYGGNAARAAKTAVDVVFDRAHQLDSVEFYLAGVLEGNLSVDVLVDGAWRTGGGTLQARKLVSGWNNLPVDTSAVQGLRLNFSGGAGSSAEIGELMFTGSHVGVANVNALRISYPENGEYYGRTALVRGYLALADNGSGAPKLTIGGKSVNHDQGAFEALISKNDVGLRHQSNATPWELEVKARYPDGETRTQIVHLNQIKHENAGRDRLRMLYAMAIAGLGDQSLDYDGARLDVGSGAVDSEVTLAVESLKVHQVPQLDPGMTNVTRGPRAGYRFSPHGMKFKKAVTLKLPYDKKLIPKGLSEQDIKTYYYDEQAGRWKALQRIAVDAQKGEIVSLTDHFTDMINGTIVVPEHPQVADFNPTSIKDIKAADPGAAINLIEPPQANNSGDASLNYPLELPAGRNGMQPQLSIAYNSGGGNGWLGVGWDLSVPSVSVETRWGVPRYHATKETETYALEGKMLTPVAHRGQPRNRQTGNVRFYPRVESDYKKIIRHGDAPGNYWWEAIDKNGKKFFYGGDGTQADLAATLNAVSPSTGQRVIAKWMLRKVVDTNGNTIDYAYDTVADPGMASSAELGTQLYPSEIRYTGHGAETGAYKVKFVRDRVRGEPLRGDVSIDGKYGFKVVMRDRLRGIEVYFKDKLVRGYELNYRSGTFGKTLLISVQHRDANGLVFNTHSFNYFDDISTPDGNYAGLSTSNSSDFRSQQEGDVAITFRGTGYGASLISGNKGTTIGGNIYAGIGVGGKSVSGGASFAGNWSNSQGLESLMDIDGDGLPDKIYRKGGGLSYRPKLLNAPGFGSERALPGTTYTSREKVFTYSVAGQLFAAGASGSVDTGESSNTQDIYFTDANGDGLMDYVKGGVVLFNMKKSAENAVSFDPNSVLSASPLPGGATGVLKDVFPDPNAAKRKLQAQNPLIDALRVWVAPYSGTVELQGDVNLVPTDGAILDEYETADGVRVAVQHNGNPDSGLIIGPRDYAVKAMPGSKRYTVAKGDRIFFRVQSLMDGAFDTVRWTSNIDYLSLNGKAPLVGWTDANALSPYHYNATTDFNLSGRANAVLNAPYSGTLKITGDMIKSRVTTDDVGVQILKNDTVVYNGTLAAATVATLAVDASIPVLRDDSIRLRVVNDTQIDLTSVQWKPTAYYTSAYQEASDSNVGPNKEDLGSTPQVQIETKNAANEYILKVPVSYTMENYGGALKTQAEPARGWIAPKTGVVYMTPWLEFNDAKFSGELYFSLKRDGRGFNKSKLVYVKGVGPAPYSNTIVMDVVEGKEYFVEFTSRDPNITPKIAAAVVTLSYGSSTPWRAPLTADTTVAADIHIKQAITPLGDPPPQYLESSTMWGGGTTKTVNPAYTAYMVKKAYAGHAPGKLLFVARRGSEILLK